MKKIKKIIIGTHNKGKFKELSDLLPKKIKKMSPREFGIKSPKETGKTFLANSKIKARYFSKKSKNICILDALRFDGRLFRSKARNLFC